jgi:beta-N-acetylhexosaminidase
VLDTWSLQKLANQTIVFPVEETDALSAEDAAKAGYGGLILFGATAPTDLGSQLATLRADVPGHLGFVVMTDEEGGGVQRMANLVGNMPWAAQMGKTMTPAQIEALAASVGSKMLANGVTMDLAPVVDVDGRAVEPGAQDPDGFRSFSGSTSVVSADGVAFMRGMEKGGVVPVLKHFPGLGGVSQNTDDGPAWTLPWATLQKVALPPFEEGIAAGAPAIMVSNARVLNFTTVPASLSEKLVTGELRDTLGFKGLIVTDSLSAGAIADAPSSLSVPQAAVEALQAGDDMVLFGSTGVTSEDLALAASTSNAIVSAVNSGALPKSELVAAAAQVLASKKVNLCPGYWLYTPKGNVFNLGDTVFYGSLATNSLPSPIAGMAPTPGLQGYWLAAADGNVYSFGDARSHGTELGKYLPAPVVGIVPTPDGGGYWLVTSKGNVFNLGDAVFYGSLATKTLPAPIVGMAATPGGAGYWLVSSKGTVYNFGDAVSHGSAPVETLPAPVVGIVSTPTGAGYWLVTSKGNVYNLGDAMFYGSTAVKNLPAPVVAMASTPDGEGYWLAGSDGSVYNFGGAAFLGSRVGKYLPAPVIGLTPG